MRFGGKHFAADDDYIRSARASAARLVHLGLAENGKVLDLGCGTGRLAIGIAELNLHVYYMGMDVNRRAMDWCLENLEGPSRHFQRLDVRSARYNPEGQSLDETFRLPIADGIYDIAHAYSLFSHMLARDVGVYFRELRRVLKPEGVAFITAFVEDDVPPVSINPAGYIMEWEGPLHCVRFSRTEFESLVREAGLEIRDTAHGGETDGQSSFILGRVNEDRDYRSSRLPR
jgi:SAM-dependent methyltransferase